MPVSEGVRVSPYGANGEVRKLWEMEAEVIEYAMRRYGGNVAEVARRLQIGRSTLRRRLERYEDVKRRSVSSDLLADALFQSAA